MDRADVRWVAALGGNGRLWRRAAIARLAMLGPAPSAAASALAAMGAAPARAAAPSKRGAYMTPFDAETWNLADWRRIG